MYSRWHEQRYGAWCGFGNSKIIVFAIVEGIAKIYFALSRLDCIT